MREAGIKVLTVREILAFGVDTHVRARMALEHLATTALTYKLNPDVDEQSLSDSDREYLSDDYKRKVTDNTSYSWKLSCKSCLLFAGARAHVHGAAH